MLIFITFRCKVKVLIQFDGLLMMMKRRWRKKADVWVENEIIFKEFVQFFLCSHLHVHEEKIFVYKIL
jgi:hypothetical protein